MRVILSLSLAFLLLFSCKKEPGIYDPNATLLFSVDTLLFDTVFTSIGSATHLFKVFNPSKQPVKIDHITLGGGNQSQFRFNIDGIPGPSVSELTIAGRDSLFVFVEVTVDPLNSNSPMVVADSMIFRIGDRLEKMNLVAWGQDIHYINGQIVCNETWANDKPYLVYNSMLVDTFCTLTITQGAKIHFHPGSRMFVTGTLKIQGTTDNPVVIQGDRLEQYYQDIPSQWVGIWLMAGSRNNEIHHADIRNGILGLQVDSNVTAPATLTMTNTVIKNMSLAGILAQGASIEADNCEITNCGQFLAALTIGGKYRFNHCTFVNYWAESARSTPSLLVNNYYEDIHGNIQARPLTQADFTNSIIYGNQESEIAIDQEQSAPLNYAFRHCIVKNKDQLIGNDISYNITPGFKDSLADYDLATGAFAIDKGDPAFLNAVTQSDIRNWPRSGNPDAGAYEFKP